MKRAICPMPIFYHEIGRFVNFGKIVVFWYYFKEEADMRYKGRLCKADRQWLVRSLAARVGYLERKRRLEGLSPYQARLLINFREALGRAKSA